MNGLNSNLDSTDWKILIELQQDACLTYTELGRRVGLSSPAVQERVHKLEDAGIITGYRAQVDYTRLGLGVRAVIRLHGECRDSDRIERVVRAMPNVINWYQVLGEDFLYLVVAVTSIDHLHALLLELKTHGDTTTSVVVTAPMTGCPVTPEALIVEREQA